MSIVMSHGGYHTVEEELGNQHLCCWCCHLVWVIDTIASNCEAGAVLLGLFWWCVAHKLSVRNIASLLLGHLQFADEFYCVGFFDASAYAICKTSEFIG